MESQAPGTHGSWSAARDGSDPTHVSNVLLAPEARIVVSTDGYFDVYPTTVRTDGDKPAYRGRIAELGAGMRGLDDRLAVRPNSAALNDAVIAWSAVNGAAALAGGLGKGPRRQRASGLKRRKVTYPSRRPTPRVPRGPAPAGTS